jgi:hypothetical protein
MGAGPDSGPGGGEGEHESMMSETRQPSHRDVVDTAPPILAQVSTTPQRDPRGRPRPWLGTILLFTIGVILTSAATWLLWQHLADWHSRGQWESYTVGQWFESRTARDILPDTVRKLFVGTRDESAPLEGIAETISLWSLCLVTGAVCLWRAIRWSD